MKGKPREREIPEDLFIATKEKGENTYKQTNAVHCPYFKEKIGFNAAGLEHIKFKDTNQRPRNKFDQYIRFKLFHLVPEILSKSGTVQGVWETQEWERQKRHGKWQKILVHVVYYEFVAVVGKARIKIVVKKTGLEGSKLFWSIIPFWKMIENGTGKIFHEGNPAED